MVKVAKMENFVPLPCSFLGAGGATALLAGRSVSSLGIVVAAGTSPLTGALIGFAPVIAESAARQFAVLLNLGRSFKQLTFVASIATTAGILAPTQIPPITVLSLTAIALATAHLSRRLCKPLFDPIQDKTKEALVESAVGAGCSTLATVVATGQLAGYKFIYFGTLIAAETSLYSTIVVGIFPVVGFELFIRCVQNYTRKDLIPLVAFSTIAAATFGGGAVVSLATQTPFTSMVTLSAISAITFFATILAID